MSMVTNTRSAFVRYSIALSITALAWLARQALTPMIGPTALPFITFFPAVAIVAWSAGLGPAVGSTIVATLAADWYFLEPTGQFLLSSTRDGVGLLAFIVGCGCIIAPFEAMRRSELRLKDEIHDRMLAQSELTTANELLATTLASIGDAVIVTDADGRIT